MRPSFGTIVDPPAQSFGNLWRGDVESWIAAGLFAAIGAMGLLRIRSRRRRQREQLLAPYEVFSRRLVGLLDEIEAVTRLHQMLPFNDPDFREPMEGRTRAAYEGIEADIRAVRSTWVRIMGVDESIRMVVESGKPLRGERRRQLDEHRAAAEDAASAEADLAACRERLARLEHAHEDADAAGREAGEAQADVEGRMARLREAGVSTARYEADATEAAERLAAARAGQVADPLQAVKDFHETRDALRSLGEIVADVEVRVDRWVELRERLERTESRVVEERGGGLRLIEADGNPDPLLAQARQEAAAAGLALDRGEAAEADEFLELGETWQARAEDVIRRQREARQFCQRALPQRRRRGEEIQASLAAGQAEVERLAGLYAAASWESVADHVRTAGRILDGIQPLLDQAAEAAADHAQRYFFAEELLVHVAQQQDQAAALLADIMERGRELEREREAVQGLRRRWRARLQELDRRVGEGRSSLPADVLALADRARSLDERLEDDEPSGRPHWPRRRRLLEQALARVDEALQEVDEELQAQRAFHAEIERAETWARDLERYLAQQAADRPRCMDAVRSAQGRLRDIRERSRQANPEWLSLVDALQVATADLQRARQWAQEDMNLFRQAQQALADAEQEVNQGRGFYQEGIAADLHEANTLLREAQREFRRQKYEASIDIALRVRESAHAALERARQEARERKRAVTQQRLAQVVGTVAQAAAAYYGARHGSRHAYGRVPPLGSRPTYSSRSWKR